jgi:hypothetical protein
MRGTLVTIAAIALFPFAVACGGEDKPAKSPSPTTAQPTSPPPPPDPAASSSAGADPKNSTSAVATGAAGDWPFSAQSAEDRAAQLERLKKDPGPIRSNWTPPGKSERYGHAEGVIPAKQDVVKAKLGDFSKYKDLAGPKFKTVKVVDKQGNDTDVYFQLPIMKGIVVINYVTRFSPPRNVQGADIVEGTFVKGNIKSMHIVLSVRPGPDEKSSVMVCDLVLLPGVPAPQSALDEELRDACGDAINAVKKSTASAP